MKSQLESFDDELAGRLGRYAEDPRGDLWKGIAARIVSVNPEPQWVVWTQRVSAVIIGGVAIMIATFQPEAQEGVNKQLSAEQHTAVGLSNPTGEQPAKLIENNSMTGGQNEYHARGVLPLNSNDDASKHERTGSVTESEKEESGKGMIVEPELKKNRDEFQAASLNDTSKVPSVKAAELDTLRKEENKSSDKKAQRHRSYSIYLTAMPTFGYQRIEPNPNDDIIIESIERISTFSTKRLGLRAEIGIEYPVSKKLNVFGGLLYYQRKQTIIYTEQQLDSTVVTSGNGEVSVEPKFSYVEKSHEYELKNVGIQLGFNYKLSKGNAPAFNSKNALTSKTIPIPRKKFLHLLGTGIEFHKALNGTNAFDNANGFSNPSAYVFVNAYYRLQYPSDGKLRAIFQPTLNYSFYINENLNAPFYVKPYALGLNFGCTYSF